MALLQVSIPDEQAIQLKHLAIDKGKNVSDLVRPLIKQLLTGK